VLLNVLRKCWAQEFSTKKKGAKLEKVYGCVTTGKEWLFMKLEHKTIYIDKKSYALEDVETLLGVFQNIIDYYKVMIE
jgi:hypothetical protein